MDRIFQSTVNKEENKLMTLFSNVGDYFLDRAIEKTGLIAYGPDRGGNLSELQLQQGQRPPDPSIMQTNPYANQLLASVGLGGGFSGGNGNMMLIAGGVVLAIGAILILRK